MNHSGSPCDALLMLLCASRSHSVQVADFSRSNGYEPEGREFESLRARHSFHAVTKKFPTSVLGAMGATGNFGATVGMWKPRPACSAVNLRNSTSSFTFE